MRSAEWGAGNINHYFQSLFLRAVGAWGIKWFKQNKRVRLFPWSSENNGLNEIPLIFHVECYCTGGDYQLSPEAFSKISLSPYLLFLSHGHRSYSLFCPTCKMIVPPSFTSPRKEATLCFSEVPVSYHHVSWVWSNYLSIPEPKHIGPGGLAVQVLYLKSDTWKNTLPRTLSRVLRFYPTWLEVLNVGMFRIPYLTAWIRPLHLEHLRRPRVLTAIVGSADAHRRSHAVNPLWK